MKQSSISTENLTPVDPESLKVGEPLPYNIYSPQGKLLAAEKYIFKSEVQVQGVKHGKPMRLSDKLPSYKKATTKQLNNTSDNSTDQNNSHNDINNSLNLAPIKKIDELFVMFEKLHNALNTMPTKAPELLAQMEHMIFDLINKDEDTAIGIIHLTPISSQAVHCVFSALLATIYSKTLGYPKRFTKLVTTSALCMNIGAIKLHHQLNSITGKLSQEMLVEVRAHPKSSAMLIQQAKIRHPTIINAILHHHERPDGEGYPAGLSSGEIPDEALIIGIVDTYLAMIGPRAYREKIDPKKALKQVLFEGHKYDNDLYTTFIKAIGVYPAGTLHKLENGDVVIVVKRIRGNATRPQVCCVIKSNGTQVNSYHKQTLSEYKQDIKSPYIENHDLKIKPKDLWG